MRIATRGGAVLTAVLAAAASSVVLTVPAFAAGPTPYCSSAQLSLKFVDTQAGLGHRYIDYAFMNGGAGKCSLRGYPRVVLLNKQDHVMTAPAAKVTDDSLSPVRTVVIKPGKRAFFTFVWVDGAFCPLNSFKFYGLRAFPPNDTPGFARIRGKTSACKGSVRVTAVRPKRYPF